MPPSARANRSTEFPGGTRPALLFYATAKVDGAAILPRGASRPGLSTLMGVKSVIIGAQIPAGRQPISQSWQMLVL